MVHNGIIENHAELRAELEAAGQSFETETDTETVAQLVDLNLRRGMDPVDAARAAFARLEGAYALALMFAGHPDLLIGAQHGAPLAVGFGESAMYLGSDSLALAPMTRRIAYLHDGDWAVVSRDNVAIFGPGGAPVNRPIRVTVQTGAVVGKDGYRHFMEKELHEHPAAIGQTLARMLDPASRVVTLPELPFDWDKVRARDHRRLRQHLFRRARRAALDGGAGPAADRHRFRQRVPLPRAAAAGRRRRPAGQPERRDRRHARRAPLHAAGRPARACRS